MGGAFGAFDDSVLIQISQNPEGDNLKHVFNTKSYVDYLGGTLAVTTFSYTLSLYSQPSTGIFLSFSITKCLFISHHNVLFLYSLNSR